MKLAELQNHYNGYNPSDVFKALEGERLVSAQLKNGDIELRTETHRIVVSSEGDCCTNTYYTDLEICELPAQIVNVELKDWKKKEGQYGDVEETQFITIKTSKGFVDFTLHADHNGYYGGWVRIERIERL